MSEPTLELRYDSLQAFETDREQNLGKGRAFVPGAEGVGEREACRLVIHHPEGGDPLELEAEAVWVSQPPSPSGIGVQIAAFGDDVRARLEAFGSRPATAHANAPPSPHGTEGEDASDATADVDSQGRPVRNLHDRIRDLDLPARDALARTGSLPERVALERRFGSSVWEALLRNPMITSSEVARMAKSGSLPTPLLTLIASNSAWLADAKIQRGLLQNPRLNGSNLDRVLRSLPQAEINRLATQTGCRAQVRAAAKRLSRA